jgi:hypothetical protein
MAVCKALAYAPIQGRHSGSTCLYSGEERVTAMAKKYALLRLKTQKPEGGFWEAFRLGLVELGSTGEEYYDESGYPFPDEVHAFVHDWLNLSGDFQNAMRKIEDTRGQHNWGAGEVHGEGARWREPATTTKSAK